MDFSWPESYLKLKAEIIEFAQRELNENLVERDLKGEFSKDRWQSCADFGIQALAAPAKYGGRDEEIDILQAMPAMEGLGYGCRDHGLTLALNAQMWTVQLPIVEFGTEEQRLKFLPDMVAGRLIGAHAITEEEAGSDAFAIQMTAKKVEAGYLLNGRKRLITLAPVADMALVFATTDTKLGKWAVTAFLVEKGTQGFRSGPIQHKMGLRTVPIGELIFENCLVPFESILGKPGSGFSILQHTLEFDRCCILASRLGAMEKQLEEAIRYAQGRKQFGQPIGKFQSVANRLVDMKLRLETARLLLYKTAWLKKMNKPATMETALLKLHLGESALVNSIDALRTYGGIGYLTENEVERDVRDAVGGVLYAGTSDIQRNIIAAMLGL